MKTKNIFATEPKGGCFTMNEFDIEELEKKVFEIDYIKDVLKYNQTNETRKNCIPFEQLNQKYISLQKQYLNLFNELSKDVDSKVYRREYAKGGTTLHRGFYSPSASDLVVGSCNRGRLLKNPTKDSNYDYEYLFDNQSNLICVYKYSDEFEGVFSVISTELFIYELNKVLSLVFEPYLTVISECQYKEGKLIRYENALGELHYGGKGCTEINVETFEYADDLLKSFCWYRYIPSIQLLDQYRYTFARDEEGYMSTYTVEQLGGYQSETDFDDEPRSYKVRVKRK